MSPEELSALVNLAEHWEDEDEEHGRYWTGRIGLDAAGELRSLLAEMHIHADADLMARINDQHAHPEWAQLAKPRRPRRRNV